MFVWVIVVMTLLMTIMATCSNGISYPNPLALSANLKKLKRVQRELSRKQKGSKNRAKARLKVAKLHYRIANIRKDCAAQGDNRDRGENQARWGETECGGRRFGSQQHGEEPQSCPCNQ